MPVFIDPEHALMVKKIRPIKPSAPARNIAKHILPTINTLIDAVDSNSARSFSSDSRSCPNQPNWADSWGWSSGSTPPSARMSSISWVEACCSVSSVSTCSRSTWSRSDDCFAASRFSK